MTNSISIVFATYNGEPTIKKTLDSLTKLEYPKNTTFNVVIVDNNSSDNVLKVIAPYKELLPLTVLTEVKKGKNAALNKALNSLDDLGELIIFSDDDVIFSSDFLLQYIDLADSQPEYSLFGGKITPYWMKEPSKAILQGIPQTVAFALTDEKDGYSKGEIKAIMIHGPNMAIRKHVITEGMSFDENIGPNGKNYVMGSETDFLFRAEEKGYKAYYDPQIIVQHIIRPYQFDSAWLKNRAYKAGRSLLVVQQRNGDQIKSATMFGYPRWALKKILFNKVKMYLYLLNGNKTAFYRQLWLTHHLLGYNSEYKKQYSSGVYS